MRLGSVEASDKNKGIGILNTVISPLLNLLIYSLWNPDVQGALWWVLREELMQPKSEANGTAVTEFILLGLVETPELWPVLFVLFFFAYMVTVGGNLSILAAILVEPKLHTPMYFFLGNLSVLDVGCITVTIPAMLGRLSCHKRAIPYGACLTQLFFFHLLVGVDCFLLTVMAYDRFLAICRPLTYSTRMSPAIQRTLVAVSWVCSFSNALTHTVAISTLNFCGPNVINHFYCDLPQLFQLSCSSTQLNELLLFGLGFIMAGSPVVLITTSYAHVAAAVLRIRSAEGRKKAFSTCGSHLTVVVLFYGSGIFNYMRLGAVKLSDKDKAIGIFNTVFNPMLNPIIYSLRNPDVQGALQRVLRGLMDPDVETNRTTVTEFILLGLVETEKLQSLVFVIFLFAYLVTVGSNLSILAAILVEPKLHTPMYFFLGNLSVLDIGCITVTVPEMLSHLLSHKCEISFGACLSQLFFFHLLAGMDCFLLTAMAYDRFLAICRPLTYSTRMSAVIQRILVVVSWVCSFSNALTHTVAISTLNFCGPNVINHFYCDLPQLFQLSCSSTQLNELLLFGLGFIMAGSPVVLITTSYAHVAAAVLRIRSAEGRKKAFSTCGSHLTVVCLFYGTGIFNYMRLGSEEASDKDKGVGVFNTVINPMLNPLIYSLRNPDVQGALLRLFVGRRHVG
ncbi:Olfactory receptor 3A2 [Galemys pyrenaicus]|uniref:Olfactory receptor 3A2 n=1 Tax=Galemys pyrenaicus TaxID=202257 RepID=A0A8J6AH27_GALPY|nr:Olfactory receptor 3A2 [Galemys pyrenaicus]